MNSKLETLRKLKQDPQLAMLALFRDFEERMEEIVEEAKKELNEVDMFGDVDSAKKVAEKVAKEEIAEFRAETNERVKSIIKKTEDARDEMIEKCSDMLAEAERSFVADMSLAKDMTKKELKEMEARHNEMMMKFHASLEKMRGPKGDEGKRGADGKDGKDGRDGKDGSPDTPDQVISKVNAAKSKIAPSQIAGLSEEIASIKREVGKRGGGSKGGGGMGNIQHESKSVGISTTTVTTSFKIAGAGYAIWAYYQGQLVMRGTHYTVGSDYKTLTLTFTPEASTTIDLIYVRAG